MKSLLSHLSVWIALLTFWIHGEYSSAVFSSIFLSTKLLLGSFLTDILGEASGEIKKIKPHDLIVRVSQGPTSPGTCKDEICHLC